MPHPPARVAVYTDTPGAGRWVENLLPRIGPATTGSREDFESVVEEAFVGIVALHGCSQADIEWMRTAFDHGHCAPTCVVVTPHTVTRSLRLRRIWSSRLHTVWAEESAMRLRHLLDQVEPWHTDPLRLLGYRLLSDFPARPSLARAIDRVCGVFASSPSEPPPGSVAALARHAAVRPDTLRRQWRDELPLRCSPKQLLSWALLLWSTRRRVHTGWGALAHRAGVRRRTLERAAVRLTGCTLSDLVEDAEGVRRRFRGWVRDRSVRVLRIARGTGVR